MRTLTRLGTATVMAAGALSTAFALSSGTASADGCTMGIQPLNPYLETCGIQSGPPKVRGAAPSQGAVIACRGVPECLSSVVNGGTYPVNPNLP